MREAPGCEGLFASRGVEVVDLGIGPLHWLGGDAGLWIIGPMAVQVGNKAVGAAGIIARAVRVGIFFAGNGSEAS